MGYFDGLTDASFKKDSQGRDLFFPWGILGAGYILQSEEQKQKIRQVIKNMYMILLPSIVLVQVFVGIWLNLVLLPIYYIWFILWLKKTTKNLERSTEKLKASESYKNSAKSHGLVSLIILEICSLLFVAAGIFIIAKTGNVLIGSISIGFFGFCSVAIGYILFSKIKKN